METVEEFKKYISFLYTSLQEKDAENLQIKKDMSEIKDQLKSANQRAEEETAKRLYLFDKLEKYMDDNKSENASLWSLNANLKRFKDGMSCCAQLIMAVVRLVVASIAVRKMRTSMMVYYYFYYF